MKGERDTRRQHLIDARQKSYEHFDRSVLVLSGGALALSLTLVDKITNRGPVSEPQLLYFAWISWAASLAAVLLSHYVSGKALTRAIKDFDSGRRSSSPGGWLSRVTEAANALGGVLFLAGVLFMVSFAAANLEALAMAEELNGSREVETPEGEIPPGTEEDGYVPPPDSPPDDRGYTPPPDPEPPGAEPPDEDAPNPSVKRSRP